MSTASCPRRWSAAASELSCRQLPQYMSAAPAAIYAIFITARFSPRDPQRRAVLLLGPAAPREELVERRLLRRPGQERAHDHGDGRGGGSPFRAALPEDRGHDHGEERGEAGETPDAELEDAAVGH